MPKRNFNRVKEIEIRKKRALILKNLSEYITDQMQLSNRESEICWKKFLSFEEDGAYGTIDNILEAYGCESETIKNYLQKKENQKISLNLPFFLRSLRHKHVMDRIEFSTYLGISYDYYIKIERNIRNPSLLMIRNICDKTDTLISDIINYDHSKDKFEIKRDNVRAYCLGKREKYNLSRRELAKKTGLTIGFLRVLEEGKYKEVPFSQIRKLLEFFGDNSEEILKFSESPSILKPESISAEIQNYRATHNLSMRAFCKVSGVSMATLRSIETRASTRVNSATVAKLRELSII